jgi:hypothetical protein
VEERLRELEAAEESGPSASPPAKPPAPSHRRLWALLALAACLLVAAVPAYMLLTDWGTFAGHREWEVARREFVARPAQNSPAAPKTAPMSAAGPAEAPAEEAAGDRAGPLSSRDAVGFKDGASESAATREPSAKRAGDLAYTGSETARKAAPATRPAREAAEKMPGMYGSMSMPAKEPGDPYSQSAGPGMPRRGGFITKKAFGLKRGRQGRAARPRRGIPLVEDSEGRAECPEVR